MEQWEIDLRAKLDTELEHGYYQISNGENGWVMGTGKGGYINYLITMKKEAMKPYVQEETKIDSDTEELYKEFFELLKNMKNNGK